MANKERVALLVAALRSGKYIQGRGSLERLMTSVDDQVKHCCLGVACRVAEENGLPIETMTRTTPDGHIVYFDSTSTRLPERVQEWFGFADHDPELVLERTELGLRVQRSATECNDMLRMTFPEIADAFEKRYVHGE
jgi:hypothetical protein